MNNRQKVKHFKMLYESTLPKLKSPIIIQSNPLKRYKCVVLAHSKKDAADRIAQHFKDFIICNDNVMIQDGDKYEVTFWIKEE